LQRAHAVIVTRCDLVTPEAVNAIKEIVAGIKPDLPIAESTHRPAQWRNASQQTTPLDALKERPIAAFCGLGNPEAFRQTLVRLGLNVIAWRTYPDHHAYSKDDVEALRTWARQLPADAALATTQKDLVKIRLDRVGERELWALQIALHLTSGQDALDALLRKTAVPV
jgi:tetraacyldisaccharide 4'-kinase